MQEGGYLFRGGKADARNWRGCKSDSMAQEAQRTLREGALFQRWRAFRKGRSTPTRWSYCRKVRVAQWNGGDEKVGAEDQKASPGNLGEKTI